MNQEKLTAVAYYRYSSHAQTEQSIEGQRHDCEAYAKQNGIVIINEYVDRAISAKSDDRPQFQKMISDAEKGNFNIVLVWKLDRFARNRYDSAYYKSRLSKAGVKLVSVMENITDRPEGILIESLLEGMAEYYSAELAQKVRRGTRESANKCKVLGPLPLGYKKAADGTYEIDEEQAKIVRYIYSRFNEGTTNADIVKELNEQGYTNSKGKPFKSNSLYTILQNERYAGVYIYDNIKIPGGIPPIISRETFDEAQKKKHRNRTTLRRHTDEREYLLTTKLFCGECGTMMIGKSGYGRGNKKYHYYACKEHIKKHCDTKNVRAEDLEYLVFETIKEMILTDENIKEIATAVMDYYESSKPKSNIQSLQAQLRETETKIANVLKAIESGIISDSVTSRLNTLEAHKQALESDIAHLKLQVPTITREQILFMLEKFRDFKNTAENLPILLRTFVNKIILYNDKIIILFNYTNTPCHSNDKNGKEVKDSKEIKKIIKYFNSDVSSNLCDGSPST